MIFVDIPGRGKLEIENVVFDYNGTIAVDGIISKSTKEYISKIKEKLNVFIATADTFGTVREQCKELNINIKTYPKENAGNEKRKLVQELNGNKTICIGNGFNDIKMFEESCLSICIIGEEGCNGKLIAHSDIVVKSIEDAFNLLVNPNRIKATLRN